MDPLSITASVLAVIGAAAKLYDVVSAVTGLDAPAELLKLTTEVSALITVLNNIETTTKDKVTSNLKTRSNQELDMLPILVGCQKTCEELLVEFQKSTVHSRNANGELRYSFRDGWYRFLKKERLATFQTRLSSWKSSLACVLEFSTFMSTTQTASMLETFESNIEDVLTSLRLQAAQQQILIDENIQISEMLIARDVSDDKTKVMIEDINTEIIKFSIEQKTLHAAMDAISNMAQVTDTPRGHRQTGFEALDNSDIVLGDLGVIPKNARYHVQKDIKARHNASIYAGNMSVTALNAVLKHRNERLKHSNNASQGKGKQPAVDADDLGMQAMDVNDAKNVQPPVKMILGRTQSTTSFGKSATDEYVHGHNG